MKISIYQLIFIVLFSINVGGCVFDEKSVVQKDRTREGDLVTWKITNGLVVQGYLGQRREHIPVQHDSEFYHPDHKRFMGQFPIDYTPRTFDKITAEQVQNLPPPYSDGPFEFNLMLNGSSVTPTDNSVNQSNHGLDHPDQVKVIVSSFSKAISPYNTKELFYKDLLVHELDKTSEKEEYGMTCYNFQADISDAKRCFGKPVSEKISGYYLTISVAGNIAFQVDSQEFTYDGLQVRWYGNVKNINQVPAINRKIWELIAMWNVAPNQNIIN